MSAPTQPAVSTPSDRAGVLIVLGVCAWMSFGFVLSASETGAIWLLGQGVLATSILHWFVLLHDAGHGGFFKSRGLNPVLGHIASAFVILPFYPWQLIHSRHHRWTGWEDLDPTMSQAYERKKLGSGKMRLVDFCWRFWVPIFGVAFSLGNFWSLSKLRKLTKNSVEFRKCVWSIGFCAGLFAFALWRWPSEFLRMYGLAYLLYLVISDPLLLSQHVGIPQMNSEGEAVRPIETLAQDEFTRTLVFPDWISKWVLLRFDHHGVHHFYPTLPLYGLKREALRLNAQAKSVRNETRWLDWLKAAKGMPAHLLVFGTETRKRHPNAPGASSARA